MQSRVAWLLPGLVLFLVAGVVAGDRQWLGTTGAAVTFGIALATALLFRRSAVVGAVCACAMALALGSRGISIPVEAAQADVVSEALDRAVAGSVCGLRQGSEWIAVELCGLETVAFGALPVAGSTPATLQVFEHVSSAEGEALARLVAGDRVRLLLRVTPARGLRNPGGADRSAERRRHGIGARARLLDARLVVRLEAADGRSTLRDWQAFRRELSNRLQLAGPGGGLLAALALGDRTHLLVSDRDALRRLGISHLLAVSGLHLALVAALAYALARGLAVRMPRFAARHDVRVAALMAAVLVALGYALLTGWAVPVRRAWVFLLASLCVLVLGRRRAPVQVLAAAGFGVAVFDPTAVFDLGARLSFVAAAALLASVPGSVATGHGLVARVAAGCASSLRMSATAIAATAPVLAWHGMASSSLGLVANGIGVPVTGLLLLPASLVALVAVSLPDPLAAVLPLAVLERPARIALEVSRAVAEWLPAAAALAPPPVFGALVVSAVVAVAVARTERTWLRVALALLVCGGLPLAPRATMEPAPPRVIVFDVGLGDAILVQGREAAILVDAGWGLAGGVDLGRTVIVPGLAALGVERLDVVVVSHADYDHRGGVASVLEAVPVAELWIPRGAGDEFVDLIRLAAARGVRVREKGAGAVPEIRGDLSLTPLWPPLVAVPRASRNDRSLVLRVDLAGSRILLTGDIGAVAEAGLLAAAADLRADILKLAHHGSRGSSTAAFLAQVGAEIGLLSAPCSTRSRLPTQEALERARAAGMSLWWTGRDGAIVVGLHGGFPTRTSWGWNLETRCRLSGATLSR